jgi:hypothetical protein
MSEALAIAFTYTEAEYTDAVRLYHRRTGRGPNRFLDAGVAVATFALGAFMWAQEGYSLLRLSLMVLSVLFLGILAALHWVVPRIWFRRDPKFQDEYQLRFDERGLYFNTRNMDSQIDWDFYQQVIEDGKFFLLVFGKNQFTVVPKRAFANAGEIERFRALVSRFNTLARRMRICSRRRRAYGFKRLDLGL